MAEILDEFPRRPIDTRYPWEEWLDGRIWKLTQETDFPDSKVESFRVAFYTAVGKYKPGWKVRTTVKTPDTLIIQAYNPNPN